MSSGNLSMYGMFQRILAINDTLGHNFLHLAEEAGELSEEIQIEMGDTRKKTDEGTLSESIDVVICAMAVAACKTDKYSDVLKLLDKKIAKWELRAGKLPATPLDIKPSKTQVPLTLSQLEVAAIITSLKKHKRLKDVAQELGISVQMLVAKMKMYRLDAGRYKAVK